MLTPSLNLSVIDKGQPSSKPTVVFVPGWRLSAEIWADQIARLSTDRRVIAFDSRSQGRSTMTAEGNSPEQRAADLDRLLKKLDLHNVVLVGWSQGAQDVVAYLTKFGRSRIAGAVLVDAAPSKGYAGVGSDVAGTQQTLRMVSLYARYPREATEGMMKAIVRNPMPAQLRDLLVAEALRTPASTGAAMLVDDLLGPDRTADLARIEVPILVITAEGSPELRQQAGLITMIPNARQVIMKNAGHAVFLDQPQEFADQIRNFGSQK